MKRYARIKDNKVAEIVEAEDIKNMFHKDLADQFQEVDETVEERDEFDGETFSKPQAKVPKVNPKRYSMLDLAKAAKKAAQGDETDIDDMITDLESRGS